MNTGLTPEDHFLLDWCRVAPASLSVISTARYNDLDWPRLLCRAESNRVGPLLFRNLREAPNAPAVPATTLAALRSSYLRSMNVATRVATELGPIAHGFRAASIPMVLLRGLSVGTALYGDTALRPFTDVDLLILRRDLPSARRCMEAAGCEIADGDLAPTYFEKYHLHATYRHKPSGVVFELHWALDHRYVPFVIPYESIIALSREVNIDGASISAPCPEHDLLANAVHVAKHAYFLAFLAASEDPIGWVIDEGHLIHLCDIALAADGCGGALNWKYIMETSRAWNVARELSVVLRTADRLFPGCIPKEVTGRLELPRLSWGERTAFRLLARGIHRDGQTGLMRQSRFAALRARPLFRPVRALDLLRYVNPGPQFLRNRYACRSRAATLLFRVVHPLVAAGELVSNAMAYLRRSHPTPAAGLPRSR